MAFHFDGECIASHSPVVIRVNHNERIQTLAEFGQIPSNLE